MIASEPILPAIIGPGVDADADVERRPALGRPARVELVERVDHVERRLDRVVGVVRVVERRAEQRHHHVADELVERARDARNTISTIRVKYSFSMPTIVFGLPVLGRPS